MSYIGNVIYYWAGLVSELRWNQKELLNLRDIFILWAVIHQSKPLLTVLIAPSWHLHFCTNQPRRWVQRGYIPLTLRQHARSHSSQGLKVCLQTNFLSLVPNCKHQTQNFILAALISIHFIFFSFNFILRIAFEKIEKTLTSISECKMSLIQKMAVVKTKIQTKQVQKTQQGNF